MTKKIYTIEEIKNIVQPIAKDYGVENVFLFGSYARGDANADSDIDLRIDKGKIKGFFMLGSLYSELTEKFNKNLDLITTASLDRDFLNIFLRRRLIFMQVNKRDFSIIKKIIKYCEEVNEAHSIFNHSFAEFKTNSVYRNSIALCILQIGELTNNLSDDFKNNHSQIPWKSIKGMRNIVAHKYGSIDIQILWETSETDIINLYEYLNELV